MNVFITILCALSLLLLVKLACKTTWRPARTVLGIGRKGQLTNVNKRKLQKNDSGELKKLRHHKGPGQRQDSLELSPRHNNPCFKHAQTRDEPWLNKIDPERGKHYHRHKRRRKFLLCAAALLILWLAPIAPTVTNDLSRLLPGTDIARAKELPCTATIDNRHVLDAVADRDADQGQAEMLDLFQRSLAPQLPSQQPINSVAHLAELPHCKKQWIALQAIHSPDARVSGLGTPSINRSKSVKSAQRSKRLTYYQKVLSWQVALTVNLDMQTSHSGMSSAEKQNIVTCDTPAHCLPPTIQKSSTTQLRIASVVQDSRTRTANSAPIESMSTEAMHYCSQHLPLHTVGTPLFVSKLNNSKMVRRPNKVPKQLPDHLRQSLRFLFFLMKNDFACIRLF